MNKDEVDHWVQVYNSRDTPHEVEVTTTFDGDTTSYGPETVSGDGDTWVAVQFDTKGELAVRFEVDGETVCEDVHEVPTVAHSRSSFAYLKLLPDDELRYRVLVEE